MSTNAVKTTVPSATSRSDTHFIYKDRKLTGLIIGSLIVWLSAVLSAAQQGSICWLSPAGLTGVIFATTILPVAAYFGWERFQFYVDSIAPPQMALLHSLKLLSGLILLYYGWKGDLPWEFALFGGLGDLLVGSLSSCTAFSNRPITTRCCRATHAMGIADAAVKLCMIAAFTNIWIDPRMGHLNHLPLAVHSYMFLGLTTAAHVIGLAKTFGYSVPVVTIPKGVPITTSTAPNNS